MKLPLPCRTERVLEGVYGFPAQNIVGFVYITPNFFNVAGTTSYYFVVQFDTGAFFESVDELLYRNT